MTRRDAEQAAAWVRERLRRSRHLHIAERDALARINGKYTALKQEKAVQILKFQLQRTEVQTLQLPAHAQILSVQLQRDALCMWAMCQPSNTTEQRTFHIYGTGQTVPFLLGYLATVQLGALVWHVFEQMPSPALMSATASSPSAG